LLPVPSFLAAGEPQAQDGISLLLQSLALARYIYYNFLASGSGSNSVGTAVPNLMDTAGQACFLLFSGSSWSEPSRISESPNQHVFS